MAEVWEDLEGRPVSGDRFLRRLDLFFTSLDDVVNECLRPLSWEAEGVANATIAGVGGGAVEVPVVVFVV